MHSISVKIPFLGHSVKSNQLESAGETAACKAMFRSPYTEKGYIDLAQLCCGRIE